jgi:ubiquinone/menaquinone biosynthesis C-methylase UbiE
METDRQKAVEAKTAALFPKIHQKSTADELDFYRRSIRYVIDQYAARFDVRIVDYLCDKEILEVGCGGRASGIIALRDYLPRSITAIDLSPENVRLTREATSEFQEPHILVSVGNALDLNFEDSRFDFVFSNGVIHHTVDMRRCFAELGRVLKSGGYLLIGVYGYGGLYGRIVHPAGMLAGKVIPFRWAEKFVNTTGIMKAQYTSLLDWFYTPIQEKHSAKEIAAWFAQEGFGDAAFLGSLKWPFRMGLLSRALFGDGYLYAMARKK